MDSEHVIKQLQDLVPRFEIHDFGSIREVASLTLPPLTDPRFSQIDYIERHLRKHSNPPKSMLVEKHYIERGFMDDYTTFYGSGLRPYPNWCKRIHFFSIAKKDLEPALADLLKRGQEIADSNHGNNHTRRATFANELREFSYASYLGFCTIKPLDGSPVGRTVLRHYDEVAVDGKRRFNCTRHYTTHLFGLDLTVCGLVFQEQDQAVSACATTALWTALSKVKDFEDIRTPTPAEITKRATQFLLSGPAIPAIEGLALQQMCQAIQSLGLSPYVIRMQGSTPVEIKSYLYSAVASGFAPVLLISRPKGGHAVTVSGMKLKSVHAPETVGDDPGSKFDDVAGDLKEIYVNDDRYSPYFKVSVEGLTKDLSVDFLLCKEDQTVYETQNWKLQYILIPLHHKIRLSFAELRQMAYGLVNKINSFRSAYAKLNGIKLESVLRLETRIMKHSAYMERLFFGPTKLVESQWKAFNERVFLSRYVGIVTISDDVFGSIDVLIDTTNIKRNPHYLAVIGHAVDEDFMRNMVEPLSKELRDCPIIINHPT